MKKLRTLVASIVVAAVAIATMSTLAMAREIPKNMQGTWCAIDHADGRGALYKRGRCSPDSDGQITLRADSYEMLEGECKVRSGAFNKRGGYRAPNSDALAKQCFGILFSNCV